MLNVTKSIDKMKNLSCLLLERKMAAKTITPPDILEQSWRTSIENHTAGFFSQNTRSITYFASYFEQKSKFKSIYNTLFATLFVILNY